MVRVFFPIDGPIQCPECKKYILPLNKIIVEQYQNKERIQCSFCGHEFEIAQSKPGFYSFV